MLPVGFIFDLCIYFNYNGFILFFFLNVFPLVLKTVENLGVSYVKGTEQYQSKLEAEIRKLKFSYRVSDRKAAWSFQGVCVSVTQCKLWEERSSTRHGLL